MNKEFSYKIVRENRIILERFNSVANLQNVMEASLAIWSDPGYNKNFNGLADLRGCKVEFGLKEIAKLFMFLPIMPTQQKVGWQFWWITQMLRRGRICFQTNSREF